MFVCVNHGFPLAQANNPQDQIISMITQRASATTDCQSPSSVDLEDPARSASNWRHTVRAALANERQPSLVQPPLPKPCLFRLLFRLSYCSVLSYDVRTRCPRRSHHLRKMKLERVRTFRIQAAFRANAQPDCQHTKNSDRYQAILRRRRR
jgi:hypothetical protein